MNIWIEWFGTFASVVVAASLTMKNIKRLRVLNLVGSLAFAVYGLLISSWPVLGLNAFIVVVNLYYLYRMARAEGRAETFDVLYVDPLRDEYVRRFLETHRQDIRRFFPAFEGTDTLAGAEVCFILREALPVSLVATRRLPTGEVELLLDYAVPAYRDYKNARFFFDMASSRVVSGVGAGGVVVFVATSKVPAHASYLRRMGFREAPGTGRYRKEVSLPA